MTRPDRFKPCHTPVKAGSLMGSPPNSDSWLNIAKSIPRILIRRALEGQQPETPQAIIDDLEVVGRGWNRQLAHFV